MVGPEMVGYGTVRYGQGDKFGRTPVIEVKKSKFGRRNDIKSQKKG